MVCLVITNKQTNKQLMLYRETNVTCSETYRKHKNILCGYNVEVLKGQYKEETTRLEMENHSQ